MWVSLPTMDGSRSSQSPYQKDLSTCSHLFQGSLSAITIERWFFSSPDKRADERWLKAIPCGRSSCISSTNRGLLRERLLFCSFTSHLLIFHCCAFYLKFCHPSFMIQAKRWSDKK